MKTDKLKSDIYNIIKDAVKKAQDELYIEQPEGLSKSVQNTIISISEKYSNTVADAIAEKLAKSLEEFVLSLNIETVGTLKSLTSPAGQVTGKLNKDEFKLS